MKMIKLVSLMLVTVLVLAIPTAAFGAANVPTSDQGKRNSGEIMVKFRPGVTEAEKTKVHNAYGGKFKQTITGIDVQIVSVLPEQASEKAKAYASNPNVIFAEVDGIAQADATVNDAYFSSQWGLAKVSAGEAWNTTTGSSDIKIAILDTGVDLKHPDLANKIVASINFSTSATDADVHGHGTHVAGIAAAITNNGTGVAGLGYNSSLMNVKVMGDDSYGYYSWISNGIIWAADHGANVINLSLGGGTSSSTLESAVNYAWNKGVVIVAAAGNAGSTTPLYPGYYTNVIAVAATDSSDRLTSFSNYGSWVDVAAPGSSIYSTLVNSAYSYKSGTSMASPFVAGLAGLVFTRVFDTSGNNLVNDEVRNRIETTCDSIGTAISNGRINAAKAVQGSTNNVTTVSISGTVKDAGNGNPIPGAMVTDGIRSTITDSTGRYAINNLPAGSYNLKATATDYTAISQTVVATATTTADFSLSPVVTQPVVPQTCWVNSVTFVKTGKNLKVTVKVTSEKGMVAAAQVIATVSCTSGKTYNFSGNTDSTGTVKFTISKAAVGTYTATVTGIMAAGYNWDSTQGTNTATYVVSK